MAHGVVLVVGGAGYVGSVLVAELVQRGHAVRVLDAMWFGEDGLAATRDRIEIIRGDMRAVAPSVLAGVGAVINVGGLSNDPTAEYSPQANSAINTQASVELARRCVEHGVPRYVLASSCSIYDRGLAALAHDDVQNEDTHVSPTAAYSVSKLEAERGVMAFASDQFCPTAIRKGTVFGFSPRMRYDLVVNTFVRDALAKGVITIHAAGLMWRPLVDVRDAARAYAACLEAPEEIVRGQVFNLALDNYQIADLALRVQQALGEVEVPCEIRADHTPRLIRSYRVDSRKIEKVLGVQPSISVEESVREMVRRIRSGAASDFDNPRYYNIAWLKQMESEAQRERRPSPLDEPEPA
jgi:nucleoside-diphosphate-sugar epimerase